ncbi:MAG: hypothetical protein CL666_08570 [Balneola sp.]|nr:hypothetical protein [Balneola sp.]|tara:strand:+ start:34567 stop:35121 length:555 start_codon:yes stop_codon:yes gene_type:complete
MEEEKIDIFEQEEKLTLNRILVRHESLLDVANFRCETDEHRDARMALFFNIDNYKRAVGVIQDLMEQASKEMKAYNTERMELAKKCGGVEQIDTNGDRFVKNVTDQERFSRELGKLEDKFSKAIKEDRERQDRNDVILSREPSRVPDPHYADPSWFPDSISPDKLAKISFMLKDMSKESSDLKK